MRAKRKPLQLLNHKEDVHNNKKLRIFQHQDLQILVFAAQNNYQLFIPSWEIQLQDPH